MRARFFRALAFAGAVVALVAVLAGCGAGNPAGDPQRAIVEHAYAGATGGVQLALPVSVPAGYHLARFWSVANIYDEQGRPSSIARSAEFTGPIGTVRVCEEVASVPGSLCPRSNVGITEKRSGLIRTVHLDSASAKQRKLSAAEWGKVKYSRATTKWSWMTNA